MQNTHFSRLEWVANMSPSQVAKIPCHKFWKICLSVFRDWKVQLRVSRKGSREAFWVNLRLELPLANQSPNWVTKNAKTQKFWNFSKSFLQQGAWLARESQELLSKLATRVSRLEWPARMSCWKRVAQVLKILTFFKIKTLSKNN